MWPRTLVYFRSLLVVIIINITSSVWTAALHAEYWISTLRKIFKLIYDGWMQSYFKDRWSLLASEYSWNIYVTSSVHNLSKF